MKIWRKYVTELQKSELFATRERSLAPRMSCTLTAGQWHSARRLTAEWGSTCIEKLFHFFSANGLVNRVSASYVVGSWFDDFRADATKHLITGTDWFH